MARYRHELGDRFERIPGPERHYRDKQTGKVVSKTFVYNRALRVRITPQETERRKRERTEGVHGNRVRWYANHRNHETWKRNGEPHEYISFAEASEEAEFIMYESFIRDRDSFVREIGYDYFRDLEEEYDDEDWGESP